MFTDRESRLIALERKQARVLTLLNALQIQAIAIGQEEWDAWADISIPSSAPFTPASSPSFPAICSTLYNTITANDWLWGSCTLTWNSTSQSWIGCKMVSFVGGGGCASGTWSAPIWWELVPTNSSSTWTLNIRWLTGTGSTSSCPLSGQTCSSTPDTVASIGATINCCGQTTFQWSSGLGCWNRSGAHDVIIQMSPGIQTVNLCGGLCVLANLPFTDSVVGSGTLVWNGTIGSYTYSGQWVACLPYAYPGYAADGCSAVSTCVLYRLNPSGQLIINWYAPLGTCPATASCSSIVSVGNVSKTPSLTGSNCSAVPATATFSMGTTAAEVALRAGASSQSITVSLPTT